MLLSLAVYWVGTKSLGGLDIWTRRGRVKRMGLHLPPEESNREYQRYRNNNQAGVPATDV